jgi:hypothetical protein
MNGPGTIILVGGINDIWLVSTGWRLGLKLAKLAHRVAHFRWQHGARGLLTFADLWRTSHHNASAERLAAMIRETRMHYPGEALHVMAHSAGTAITAYALERLKVEDAITSAVFVGSGLSPGYDLTACLKRCAADMLSVESRLDFFYLGLGTSVLGSCDRHWGPAAGMVGFRSEYPMLTRIRWRPRYLREGWTGGHLSEASPWFVRGTIAKWIRQAEASVLAGSGSGFLANTHSSIG